jgi:hypothetical protein
VIERSFKVLVVAAVCACFVACRSKSEEPASSEPSPNPPTVERFAFELPPDFVPVALRGEGSESLRAPSGARTEARAGGFDVRADPDFALHVQTQPPALLDIAGRVEGARRVLEESNLIIFKSGDGYGFALTLELVPEWDENDRRHLGCSSAGVEVASGTTRAQALRFSKAAVEKMVAACRSLELPPLE